MLSKLMLTHRGRKGLARLAGAVVAVASVPPAQADQTNTYDLSKGVTLTVPASSALTVEALHSEKVWTHEPLDGTLFRCNEDPNTAAACTVGPGPTLATVAIPGTGLPATTYSATLLPAPNSGFAISAFAVGAYTPKSTTITAGIGVTGSATAKRPLGTTLSNAFATSTADLRAGVTTKTGDIKVVALAHLTSTSDENPKTTAISGFSQTIVGDPVTYALTDLVSGHVLTGTLFDLQLTLDGAAGDIGWDSAAGTMTFDTAGPTAGAELHIAMDSPFTLQHGRLDLVIEDGVVTTSSATGLYAGLLPAVGTSGKFGLPLGDVDFGFDFSSATPDATSLVLDFTDSNAAFASVIDTVPEPSGWMLLLCGSGVIAWRRTQLASNRPI